MAGSTTPSELKVAAETRKKSALRAANVTHGCENRNAIKPLSKAVSTSVVRAMRPNKHTGAPRLVRDATAEWRSIAMHRIELPDWAEARGKPLNHFPALEAGRTALVNIDMQNAFLTEDQTYGNAHARDI